MSDTPAVTINGDTASFSIGVLISAGWELFKKSWASYYKMVGVLVGVSVLIELASIFAQEVGAVLVFLIAVVSFVVNLFLQTGWIYGLLKIVRGKIVTVSDMFSQDDKIVNFLFVNLVFSLIVVGGLILFIIPGIYWALKYSMAPYLAVDKKMGVKESLRASAQMTNGIKWQLIFLGLVLTLLNILGILTLLIGLIITVPVTFFAWLILYDHLLARLGDDSGVKVAADVASSAAPQTVAAP